MSHKHTLLSFTAGALLASGAVIGVGASAAPAPADALVAATYAQTAAPEARTAMRGRAGARIAALRDPALAAIVNLRAIERVYRYEGREEELPAYLRQVLARTGDPTVRNYVNLRLARIEMRDRDAKAALEALQRGLDENLERLR